MTGRFSERPTRHTGTTTIQGWRLKRYEITLDGETIDPVHISAVDAVLRANLPGAAGDAKVGFVIVHHGAQQVWILADLSDGDIISQHTFFANFATPTEFAQSPPAAQQHVSGNSLSMPTNERPSSAMCSTRPMAPTSMPT